MNCKNCSYYWKDDDDRFARCHYCAEEWLDGTAPCEQEDLEREYEDLDEEGY